jgi:phosphatidylglycerophosphate synthase
MSFADQLTLARAAAVPIVIVLFVWDRGTVLHARDLGRLKTWTQAVTAGVGGLAAAGAFDDSIAVWALAVALALTWISGLDYARLAPRLLRGDPTAGSARGTKSSESTFSSSPASRQTLP